MPEASDKKIQYFAVALLIGLVLAWAISVVFGVGLIKSIAIVVLCMFVLAAAALLLGVG